MNSRLATLDRMLDDLKSTVNTDDEDRRTPLGVSKHHHHHHYNNNNIDYNHHQQHQHQQQRATSPDPSFLQVFRSSSRSSSRAGSATRRDGSIGAADGVVDGGRLTHHHKEYTSPDQSIRTVADTYQYDSGDTHASGNFQKKVVKSTYSSYKVDGGLSADLEALKRGPSDLEMERALTQESRNILNSTNYTVSTSDANNKGRDGHPLTNGHLDDDMIVNEEKGSGEVRRIVWRNRYEKTYDATDSTTPTVTIEKDARSRRYNASTIDMNEATTISSLTRPHVPPQISPGGQSWADPVPLPTPPQVSPKEPGVAYIYNYGSSGGSAVQPLPPLNYVTVVPPGGCSDVGGSSPTQSAATTGQPVIYHYSYHYTIQPGQPLPEGAHPPSSPPPALQIVQPPATGYSSAIMSSAHSNKSSVTEVHSNMSSTNRDVQHHHHHTSTKTVIDRTRDREPLDPNYTPNDGKPRYPDDDSGKPYYPGDGGKPGGSTTLNYSVNTTNYRNETHQHPPFPTHPSEKAPRDPLPFDPRDPNGHPPGTPGETNRNTTININKTTTHTSHTSSTRDGNEYPPNDNQVPLTSTPYRGRSRSPDRRYPTEPRYPSGPSDSLERVRRPHQPGLPFPETSPVKPQDGTRIPRKVDELMTDFPLKNGGPHRPGYGGHPDSEPLLSSADVRITQTRGSRQTEVKLLPAERNEINTMSPSKLREEREKSKNQAGPPVYYPPGHEAFSESMHTMTLKEDGRRGNAKWRREAAAGHKESSSHSESKGGMAMVPICLPLCCGAACTIM